MKQLEVGDRTPESESTHNKYLSFVNSVCRLASLEPMQQRSSTDRRLQKESQNTHEPNYLPHVTDIQAAVANQTAELLPLGMHRNRSARAKGRRVHRHYQH